MYCSKCHQQLSEERISALRFLNKQIWEYVCTSCSNEKPIKILYSGLSGVSLEIRADAVGSENGIYLTEKQNKQEIIEDIAELNEDIAFLKEEKISVENSTFGVDSEEEKD
jgi:hypothetical protein